MSKNFLITAHTQGSNSFIRQTIAEGLLKSLRYFFPDCFIVLASQSDVTFETQQYADVVVIDKVSTNVPYGAGEVALVHAGLEVLERFGRTDCFKLVYDFAIDETNYMSFDNWQSHGKDFVSCWWRSNGLGIGTWVWYGTVDILKKIYSFDYLDMLVEHKILSTVTEQGLINHCFIYENEHEMLNNTWVTHGDLVNAGGAYLKHNYGTVACAVVSNSRENSLLPLVLHSVVNQSRSPEWLILFDNNAEKVDLRTIPVYNNIFSQCEQRGIIWSVVFGNDLEFVKHLGVNWCWQVDENASISNTELEMLYKTTITNFGITDIKNNSRLFRIDK